jgi:hypothetical protein
MKTTYSQFLLCCMILCGLFTLSNCKDDCDRVIRTNLVDLDKYVPYTGNDTVRFLRNSSDTQIFVGQGLERFYVKHKKQEDYACPEEHESVRIRFKNTQNNNEIKMEYIFDPSFGSQPPNPNTSYKFYYNSIDLGERQFSTYEDKIEINSFFYDYVNFYSTSSDTIYYLAFKSANYPGYPGILKIKYLGDTLTLIR